MQTAYNIFITFCVTINVCVLIVNIRLMVCRWFDVQEERTRLALKAGLIKQREASQQLEKAEKLIKWEDV